jgi:eukaryotic-like serine/threonine-protein kinase
MKQGDVIRGYKITSEPTNAGGGKCMWAFAEKDGAQYFLKRFLDPKRPRDDAADTKSVRIRRQTAREFEERHQSIMKRLNPTARGGGNLVLARNFFHEGSTYYKVTDRIDTSSLEKPQSLEPQHKKVLLKTLALSLQQLHEIQVVHGDLKPQNVLVQKRDGAAFHSAKLIDFDDSYWSGRPPEPDDIAGDSLYGAPEWRRYIQREGDVGPEALTCAVDVFALGLMTHLYLTGELPYHDDRYGSPADAVNAGQSLQFHTALADPMVNMLRAMASPTPRMRPRVATFLRMLSDTKVCALQDRRRGTARPVSAAGPAEGGHGPASAPRARRVRRNLKWAERSGPAPKAPDAPAPEAAPAEEPSAPPDTGPAAPKTSERRASRVRINLGDRDRRA